MGLTILRVGYSAVFYYLSLTLDTIPIGVAHAVWSGGSCGWWPAHFSAFLD
ncbi:SMR family transporter [Euryarchaeota archaeon]|nr:SMR family transporter [Euryarchaeota archaeon]